MELEWGIFSPPWASVRFINKTGGGRGVVEVESDGENCSRNLRIRVWNFEEPEFNRNREHLVSPGFVPLKFDTQ